MKKLIFIILLINFISCGKTPEEEYFNTLKNFKESDTGSIELTEALVLRRKGRFYDHTLRPGASFLYSVKGSSVTLHGKDESRTFTLPGGAPFHGAALKGETGYIAAGRHLLIYNDSSSFDRAVKFPKDVEVYGVNASSSGVVVLAGKKLYRLREPGDEPELIFEKDFSSPVKKTYRGFLTTSGRLTAVVLGFAGRYHIAVVNPGQKKILAEKISAAGSTCYLKKERVSYVSGGSGSWVVTRFNSISKKKQTSESFSSIVHIALFKEGFALETSKGIELYDYSRKAVNLPVKGVLQGRWLDNLVVTLENERTAVVPFEPFRKDLVELRKELPALFKVSSGK